jgi:hypothetical protein
VKEQIRKLYYFSKYNIWAQVVLVLIILFVALLEIQAISAEIRDLRAEKMNYPHEAVPKEPFTADPVSPDEIEEWMTFSYINTVFKLPTDYLADTLGIVDSAYPKLSILRYVRTHHIPSDQFISELKRVLIDYSN